ncbi:MAG: PilN domain-containing protein [Acidobacteriota bacterium]|nr:PilN domain-containing protein [Acidobacteriota bacterium]
MIKINLASETRQAKPRAASQANMGLEGGVGGPKNFLLIGVLALGILVAGGWYWTLSGSIKDLEHKNEEAQVELDRLAEIRKKGDEYKRKKQLLEHQIQLITELKKQQTVPVHILDQVSKNLPEFLWLESMSASKNQINITGKATTFNSVSTFYSNLSNSGFFREVKLGRTFETATDVNFSLTCAFARDEPAEPSEEDTDA